MGVCHKLSYHLFDAALLNGVFVMALVVTRGRRARVVAERSTSDGHCPLCVVLHEQRQQRAFL
jgi:hypothetical protein